MVVAITLNHATSNGIVYQASFEPEKGMNLTSFKINDFELIDQTTRTAFNNRFSGLGPLIGPHFYRRQKDTLPFLRNEDKFSHIAYVKEHGIEDPFSHGIARYAPWKYDHGKWWISGILSGKDKWNDISLAELEGQDFTIRFHAQLTNQGLELDLSIVSDTDSLIGIHYYYYLPEGNGVIKSRVQKTVLIDRKPTIIPSDWNFNKNHELLFNLDREADFTFTPFPNPMAGEIVLETSKYHLLTKYWSNSQENCWQLYHPKDSSYVCIEPISSQDPLHPNLTVSQLKITLFPTLL